MTTLYKDILEGNYVVGGSVHLKDGLIENNPFSKKLGNCLAANWMLKNKKKAKAKIKEVMKEQRLGTHEVDECYGYAIYYFLEKEDREFKEDFFGEGSSETYNIDIYCLFKLKIIVYEYRNEMRNRLKNTLHLIDTEKEDADNMPRRCISYNILTRDNQNNEGNLVYSYNEVIEFEELQDILDNELVLYDEYFKLVGLKNFSFRDYVYHMFLSNKVLEIGDDGLLTKESFQKIAESLEMTPVALKKINKIVKNLMKTRKDLFGDVPELIGRLVNGKTSGWTPIYNK